MCFYSYVNSVVKRKVVAEPERPRVAAVDTYTCALKADLLLPKLRTDRSAIVLELPITCVKGSIA